MLRFGAADYSDVARTYEVIASWNTELTDYTYYDNQSKKDSGTDPRTQYVYADDVTYYEDGHDGYIYCMGFGARRNFNAYNYDITYFTINYGDGSYDKSETVRLSSGLNYYTDNNSYNFYFPARWMGHVHDGVLYRMRNNRKVIDIIPLNNVAAYRAVRIISDGVSDYIEDLNYCRPHNGGVWLEIYHYTSTSYNRLNGIVYPDGVYVIPEYSYQGTNNNHNSDYKYYYYGRTVEDDLISWGWYDASRLTRLWEANYLGTINNLSSPITKTAAQTMKIVYTLTDVDDEDEEG
jgi:hypothetical protein